MLGLNPSLYSALAPRGMVLAKSGAGGGSRMDAMAIAGIRRTITDNGKRALSSIPADIPTVQCLFEVRHGAGRFNLSSYSRGKSIDVELNMGDRNHVDALPPSVKAFWVWLNSGGTDNHPAIQSQGGLTLSHSSRDGKHELRLGVRGEVITATLWLSWPAKLFIEAEASSDPGSDDAASRAAGEFRRAVEKLRECRSDPAAVDKGSRAALDVLRRQLKENKTIGGAISAAMGGEEYLNRDDLLPDVCESVAQLMKLEVSPLHIIYLRLMHGGDAVENLSKVVRQVGDVLNGRNDLLTDAESRELSKIMDRLVAMGDNVKQVTLPLRKRMLFGLWKMCASPGLTLDVLEQAFVVGRPLTSADRVMSALYAGRMDLMKLYLAEYQNAPPPPLRLAADFHLASLFLADTLADAPGRSLSPAFIDRFRQLYEAAERHPDTAGPVIRGAGLIATRSDPEMTNSILDAEYPLCAALRPFFIRHFEGWVGPKPDDIGANLDSMRSALIGSLKRRYALAQTSRSLTEQARQIWEKWDSCQSDPEGLLFLSHYTVFLSSLSETDLSQIFTKYYLSLFGEIMPESAGDSGTTDTGKIKIFRQLTAGLSAVGDRFKQMVKWEGKPVVELDFAFHELVPFAGLTLDEAEFNAMESEFIQQLERARAQLAGPVGEFFQMTHGWDLMWGGPGSGIIKPTSDD